MLYANMIATYLFSLWLILILMILNLLTYVKIIQKTLLHWQTCSYTEVYHPPLNKSNFGDYNAPLFNSGVQWPLKDIFQHVKSQLPLC